MTGTDVVERFAAKAPVALMLRGLLDFALADDFLNPLAEQLQQANYTRDIEFAHLVALLSDVVFRVHPSVRAAYRNNDRLRAVAGLKCFYEKLQRVEPHLGAAFVAAVADRVAPLVGSPLADEPLAGLRLLVLDGNHLAATERRLDGMEAVVSPLPGQVLVLREHASGLFRRVLPWEDGHDNERLLLHHVPDWFGPGDCVVADSGLCTETLLRGLSERGARFVVRHHGSVGLNAPSERRRVGRGDGGTVYEYEATYAQTEWRVRVVEVELDRPTRAGATVIRLLTNLTQEQADGLRVAGVYLKRRTIESAFQELEAALHSEVSTLAYPRAALLALCVSLGVYNLLQVVRATVERQRIRKGHQELSGTLLSQEVRTYLGGLGVALQGEPGLPDGSWPAERMRAWLEERGERLELRRYARSVRGEKATRDPQRGA